MPSAGDNYVVKVKPSHIDWGEYRNPTNREPIEGESYVKIPSQYARKYEIRRGDLFTAHFANGYPSMQIKAAGNGPYENGVQYAKQFEGIGRGACKAFTPWYQSCGVVVGDQIKVEFTSSNEIVFSKL
ncbi:MAG: hypothetical protein II992_08205 [Lachnospiraceae bacterium]|nr:hypothetical protein [Lachnospiraceae bacterium]